MTEDDRAKGPERGEVKNIEVRFWNGNPEVETPWDVNVVAVAVHPSGINEITPYIDALVSKGSGVSLVTGDVATGIARNQNFKVAPRIGVDPVKSWSGLFSLDKTNLLLVGCSSGPEMKLETDLTLQAIRHKKETGNTLICFLEYDTSALMGNMLALDQWGVDLANDIDAYFTSDRMSAGTYRNGAFSRIPPEKFITIGPASWDALRGEDTESENREVRAKMGIDQDALVITHFAARGLGVWSEMEIDATPAVLNGVFEFAKKYPDKKIVFIYRFHPGDSNPEILSELIAKYLPKNLPENLKVIITQPNEAVKEGNGTAISAISNLATSAASTSLVGVSLRGSRGRPYTETGQEPLYYLSPAVREQFALYHYELPAPVQEGAAGFCDSPKELVSMMEEELFNHEFRKNMFKHQAGELRNRYRFKGSATAIDRGILQIRNLLKKYV